ncbi:protein argonaute-2-like [Centruroides sculpturatus]|uniref:protein argonaute-2-like n=1 Tax=Centruroides sculpturatus TaxID=218467 RepID=UPI000C6EBCB4|nr:protein argonaute-2-like [Centruroides sculpturatus]
MRSPTCGGISYSRVRITKGHMRRGNLSQDTLQQISNLGLSSTDQEPSSSNITSPVATAHSTPPVVTETSTSIDDPIPLSQYLLDNCSILLRRFGLELKYSDKFRQYFAVRPEPGKEGTPIELLSNYYPIKFPRGKIFHYEVEIKMENTNQSNKKKYKCQNTKIKRKIMDTLFTAEATFSGFKPAFDGMKNIYTRKRLPIDSEETYSVTVNDEEGRQLECEIKIKPVNKKDDYGIGNSISLEPLHQLLEGNYRDITPEIIIAMISMETILRHCPALRLVPVGRSFFQKSERQDLSLDGSREIWFGHYQSLKLTKSGAMMNVDRSATVFFKGGPVIEFMLDVLFRDKRREEALRNIRFLTKKQIMDLKAELKGVIIKVTHLPYPRKYKISDITEESASETYFNKETNGEEVQISVSDYFREQYPGLRLKYDNLPCLVSERPPLRKGMPKKKVYLPFEVCEIIQQHYNKKLSDEHKRVMIKETTQPPKERFEEIKNLLKRVKTDSSELCKEFGIDISLNELKLVGRILNTPELTYKNNIITPKNGSWNLENKKFYEGSQIDKWSVINFSAKCSMGVLNNFARCLLNEGSKLDVNLSREYRIINGNAQSPGDVIKRERNENPFLELVIIVIPAKPNDLSRKIYSEIKTVAETELGLKTQCVKDTNIQKKPLPLTLICNICQKINVKLGGINNSLSLEKKSPILSEGVIIIGADCSHPSPADAIPYSIAAVVGSIDNLPSKYTASIRLQLPTRIDNINTGREIIVELKSMLIEVIKTFKGENKTTPKKIIFYRDGVADGDFHKVIDYELKQIREACSELNMDNDDRKTTVTFIIVGKRHHTRFTPVNPSKGVGKHGNVPPGTTVDTDLVHPIFFDFFTCSHFGIQGTSRPTHYTVLHDDNRFTADQLQSLTYQLCHTYSSCTKSISIPCAVKYADLAAYRAKQYLIASQSKIPGITREISNTEVYQIPDAVRMAIEVDENIKKCMFFI